MGLPRPACRGWRLGRRVVTAGALAVLALAVASAAVPIGEARHLAMRTISDCLRSLTKYRYLQSQPS